MRLATEMRKRKSGLPPAAREHFQQFLFEMDDVLEPYVSAAIEQGFALDYTFDSLAELERFWIATSDGRPDDTATNRAARYLGEVFRRLLGGVWSLCDKDPQYLYYGLPVITRYATVDIEFCPIEVFSNFATRRELGMLRRAVESHIPFRSTPR